MKISPFVFISFGGGRQKFHLQFCVPATWEAEATRGGLQIILPPNYLLMAVACGFCLSIGGGAQNNLLSKKKFSRLPPFERRKPVKQEIRTFYRQKKSLGGGRQWLPHPKKVDLSAKC